MLRNLFLLCSSTLPLFAQGSITVTASRNIDVPADQVTIAVGVQSPLTTSRDEVLAAVQGSIVTAANFSGLRTTQVYDEKSGGYTYVLVWGFTPAAPLSDFKTTASQLTALQQIVALKKNGMSLTISVQGTQVSYQAAQRGFCSNTDLLADARAEAMKMASAAGLGLGNVLAMSGASTSSPGPGGIFSSPYVLPYCTLMVKFAVTGF